MATLGSVVLSIDVRFGHVVLIPGARMEVRMTFRLHRRHLRLTHFSFFFTVHLLVWRS